MNEYVKSNYYKIHDFEVIYLSLFQILAYKVLRVYAEVIIVKLQRVYGYM